MSSLMSGYITLEKLKQIVATVEQKQAKGFAFTMSVNEETNNFGQNISMYAEQTKEQRDAGTPKWYFGNGKVFWTDGKIATAKKSEGGAQANAAAAPYTPPAEVDTNDLPF